MKARLCGTHLDLSAQTSVPVLGAVIDRLALLLTNDSGPAHLAYALQTPVVTVFGATDPSMCGVRAPAPARLLSHPIACRPCNVAECSIGYQCLAAITAEEVVQAGLELLDERRRGEPEGQFRSSFDRLRMSGARPA